MHFGTTPTHDAEKAENNKYPRRGEERDSSNADSVDPDGVSGGLTTLAVDKTDPDSGPKENGDSGEKNAVHPGQRYAPNGDRDKWGQLLAEPRPCRNCGNPFRPTVKDERRRGGKFCSLKCHGASRRGQTPAPVHTFITPPSDKAMRIRANGLVNKRLKLGWFTRPTICACCGNPAAVEFHHHDYAKPDQGRWICRSCHGRSHQIPEILDAVPIITLNRVGPPPKPHGRGGRKGPTGNATGRRRLVRVDSVTLDGENVTEHLACGHTFTRPEDGINRVQRRCPQCPRLPVSSPPPACGADRGRA